MQNQLQQNAVHVSKTP